MTESVIVAVRVRPLNAKEKAAKDTEIQTITGKSIKVTSKDKKTVKTFTFDYVYGPDSTQQQVYKDIGTLYLENTWKGFNSCLFAYGQTGSGKSYSMTGSLTDDATKGIISRGCEEMFSRIDATKSETVSYAISVSFLEIYNEKLKDLLDPKNKTKTISIRESPTKGIYVENCCEIPVKSYKEIDKLLTDGNAIRAQAATAMNATSSRSHSVLTIFFTRNETIQGKQTQRAVRVNLVDLAGSERQSKTEAEGERLQEAISINKSLSALGNVIAALAEQASKPKTTVFIPYRDSILTRLLTDSLGGNSKTIMIAAASPATSSFEETVSTLQYADRVKQIKNKPTVQESETDKLIRQLQEEIERLKAQLAQAGGGSAGDSSSSSTGTISEEELAKFEAEKEALAQKQEETARLEQELLDARLELEQKLAEAEQTLQQQQQQQTTDSAALSAATAALASLTKQLEDLDAQNRLLVKKQQELGMQEQLLAQRQGEIEALKIRNEQMQQQLITAMKNLQEMTRTQAERDRIAQENEALRQEYLDKLGLGSKDSAYPRLSNLSTSPDFTGSLVYVLKPGKTTFGSSNAAATGFVTINGLGVEPKHATFTFDEAKKTVTLAAEANGRVLVNGVWVNEKTSKVLAIGDSIIIGKSFAVRLLYDAVQKYVSPIPLDEQASRLEAELAVAAGKVATVAAYASLKADAVVALAADSLCDDANDLAKKMGRRVTYTYNVVQGAGTVEIIVTSLEVNEQQTWSVALLQSRVEAMFVLWQKVQSSPAGSKVETTPETDPFFNPPPDVLLGKAPFSLHNILYTDRLSARLPLAGGEDLASSSSSIQQRGKRKRGHVGRGDDTSVNARRTVTLSVSLYVVGKDGSLLPPPTKPAPPNFLIAPFLETTKETSLAKATELKGIGAIALSTVLDINKLSGLSLRLVIRVDGVSLPPSRGIYTRHEGVFAQLSLAQFSATTERGLECRGGRFGYGGGRRHRGGRRGGSPKKPGPSVDVSGSPGGGAGEKKPRPETPPSKTNPGKAKSKTPAPKAKGKTTAPKGKEATEVEKKATTEVEKKAEEAAKAAEAAKAKAETEAATAAKAGNVVKPVKEGQQQQVTVPSTSGLTKERAFSLGVTVVEVDEEEVAEKEAELKSHILINIPAFSKEWLDVFEKSQVAIAVYGHEPQVSVAEAKSKAEKEIHQLRSALRSMTAEKERLRAQLEQRDAELERLREDMYALSKQTGNESSKCVVQ